MHKNKSALLGRRGFLQGTAALGAMLLGGPSVADARLAAASAGIRAHDWHSLPRNDGSTVTAGPEDMGGDFQLARAADGSFEPGRTFISEVFQSTGWFNMV